MSAQRSTVGRWLIGALVCVAPAALGAGAPERGTIKTGPHGRAEAARGWDGKVQGRQLLTAIELRFEDPRDFEAFAAGRLPIGLTLKSGASGQTVRLAPALVLEGFRAGGTPGSVTLYVLADNLLAPVWDETGCIESRTAAGSGPDGRGVEIASTYTACGSAAPPNARQVNPIPGIGVIVKTKPQGMVAGSPIGNIVVKGGKNPGGNLHLAVAPTEVVEDASARVRSVGAGRNLIVAVVSKGTGEPKANGF